MSSEKRAPKRPIVQETPVEEINHVKDTCPVLLLKVMKRTPDGKIATVEASLNWDTLDLINGRIETYLEAKAGGGVYTIEGRDPADPSMEVIPRYQIVLQGAPKDPRHVPQQAVNQAVWGGGAPGVLGAAPTYPGGALPAGGGMAPAAAYHTPGVAVPQPYGPGGQVSLPPRDALPAWAHYYPPEHQWKLYYDSLERSGRLPPGSSMHSDQLANTYANVWQGQWSGERAENAKLREKLEAAELRAREEAARYQKQVEELRVQQEKEKHAAEMAALRSEIASLRDGGGGGGRGIDWGTVIAAGVPIVTAVVTLVNERAKANAMMLLESRKLEQKQQESMLALMAPKSDNTIDKVLMALPAIAPFVLEWVKNNGAAAQAEIIEMKNNGQLMYVKMLHDMIQDLRNDGEPPPAWLPAVEAAINAIQGWGQMAAVKAQAQAQQQQGARQQAPKQPVGGLPQGAPNWADLAKIDTQAAELTKLVWDQMPKNAGFHTHEWALIIFNIHALTEIPAVAGAFIEHLEHLRQFSNLPPILRDVFEDDTVIDTLLNALPIAQINVEYTNNLAQTIKQLLADRAGVVDTEGGDEEVEDEDEDDEEEVEETSAMAAGAAE